MIRPLTVLCLLAACASGLYLYSEKHRTALLDRQIADVIHQTEAARARTGLLRAEWALMNEPGRLQDMAERYLALKPMAPTQFVQLSELSARLPAPVAASASGAGTDEDDEASPAIAGGGAPAPTGDAPAAEAPAAETPAAMAADGTAPASPVADAGPAADHVLPARKLTAPKPDVVRAGVPVTPKLLAHAGSRAAPARHQVVDRGALPDRGDMPENRLMQHSTPLPLAAPQPVRAHVYSTVAHPEPPGYRPGIVAAQPRYAPPGIAGGRIGAAPLASALGGARSLPPPTPYNDQDR